MAYLVWKGDSWADEWLEVTGDQLCGSIEPGGDRGVLTECIPALDPREGNYPEESGFLILQIEEWGDPLIGGL